MKKATHAEVMNLVFKHEANPRIQAIRASIADSRMRALVGLSTVEALSSTLVHVGALEGYGIDFSTFEEAAAAVSRTLSEISSLMTTLASELRALGEEVEC